MMIEVKWFNYHEPLTGEEEVFTSVVTEEEYKMMKDNSRIGFTNIKRVE